MANLEALITAMLKSHEKVSKIIQVDESHVELSTVGEIVLVGRQ